MSASKRSLQMNEKTVGIRELKMNLSKYLAEVRAGTRIVITEHGRSMVDLEPMHERRNAILRNRMVALREAGVLDWSGLQPSGGYKPRRPTIRLKTDHLASDLLLEDRR